MRLDIHDLRLFLAVVDAGSITHGAAEVGLSLPAASERLRDMEAACGVKLLERGRRGVLPTPAGETLVHHARLVHRQVAQMRNELGEHARGLRTAIALLAPTVAITEFLPARLSPWMRSHPDIDIELKERQSAETVKALAAGLAEIGIISDTVSTEGLTLRPFAVDRLVVVAPGDHPVADRKRVYFADIVHENFLGLAGGALQDNLDARAAMLGIRLRMRLRTRSFEGICRLASGGVGIGIVPEITARHCRRSMQFALVRLADDWATRQLSVCTQSESMLTPATRLLVEQLTSPEAATETRPSAVQC